MALVQIVQWDGGLNSNDVFAWRWLDRKNPGKSDELGNWTQLIVNEAQEAILFKDGQALDLFGPGRHTLSTDNIPVLRRLMNLPTGGESAFKAYVWFINKVNVLDIKWGTQSPILLRDPEYQVPLNVRAYGQFGIRITESRKFLLKLAGSKTQITRDDLINYFRGLLLSRMGDMLATYIAKKKVSIFEINAYLRDMSDEAVGEIKPVLEEYGIEPVNFYFGSVNVPDDDESVRELKRAMTERARMNLKGYTYQQERSFDVLQTAAGNTGGEGGSLMNAGVGLGTGMGLGGAIGQMASQMGNYINPNLNNNNLNNNMQGAAPALTCPKCGKPYAQGSAFCPSCGAPLAEQSKSAKKFCVNCGAELDASMKFCPKCGKQA